MCQSHCIRAAMGNESNSEWVTARWSAPHRELLAQTRMYVVMSEYGLDGGRNAFVKVYEGFTARKASPSLLQ